MITNQVRTSHELIVANPHELVHGCPDHVLCDYDGSRYTVDLTESALVIFITYLGEIPLRILEGASHCYCRRRGGWPRR